MPKKVDTEETGAFSVKFENGALETFRLADIPEALHPTLALHGLGQKIVDSYAGKRDEAHHIAMAVYENLLNGEWSLRGEAMPRITILVRALLRVAEQAGQTVDEAKVKATVSEMEKDDRKALEANPKVKAVVEAIKAEDAAKRLEAAQEAAQNAPAIDVAQLIG